MHSRALQSLVRPFEFLDLQKLIAGNVGEMLSGIAGGPPDFQIQNACGFPQSNMLFQWRSTERPSAANGSINRTTSAFVFDADFDARSNGRAITFHSNQLQ